MLKNFKPLLAFQRQSLALVFSLLAATSVAFGQPNSHAVTIDFTQSPISYSDAYSHNGVVTPNPTAYRLVVYANETVVWKAKTSGTKNVVAIFFPNGTPFADQNGRPLPIIVWSAKDVNSPTATVVEQSGSYEYSVAAYDEDKGKSYTDDPKIIVGNGGIETDERVGGRVSKNNGKNR
jgi:hypothetical protein